MIVGKWEKWLQDMTNCGYIIEIIKVEEGDIEGDRKRKKEKI